MAFCSVRGAIIDGTTVFLRSDDRQVNLKLEIRMKTEHKQASLLGILGKAALGALIVGGGYAAFKNREKIAETTAPARSGIVAWWKKVVDSALGDDFGVRDRRPVHAVRDAA